VADFWVFFPAAPVESEPYGGYWIIVNWITTSDVCVYTADATRLDLINYLNVFSLQSFNQICPHL